MRLKGLAIIAVFFCFLTSCENAPGIENPDKMEVLPYFDLKGFVNQEIEKLDGRNVTKISRINGVSEQSDRITSTEEWKEELGAFFDADINKPSLIDSYTTEVEKDILIHRAKPEAKVSIQEIRVRIVNDHPVWITFKAASESMFYTSFTHGGIYMNNRENRIDHYELETTQKIWFLKPNNMKIQGAIN